MLSFNDTSEETERGCERDSCCCHIPFHHGHWTGCRPGPCHHHRVTLAILVSLAGHQMDRHMLFLEFMSQQCSRARSSYLRKAAKAKRQLAASLTSDKEGDAPILLNILDNISTVIGSFRLRACFASVR